MKLVGRFLRSTAAPVAVRHGGFVSRLNVAIGGP